MDESERKKLLVATLISLAAAIATGALLGFAAGAWRVGFTYLVLPVGLAAGVPVRLLGTGRRGAALAAALLCSAVGLGAYAFIGSRSGTWTAEKQIPPDRLDRTAREVLALQMCHERKIMGVWDYEGVPQAIKDEADKRIDSMSGQEKFALCDKTFARRINDKADRATGISAWLEPAMWIVLTGVLAVAPTALKNRYE